MLGHNLVFISDLKDRTCTLQLNKAEKQFGIVSLGERSCSAFQPFK